ncbi:GTPase inhibitor [Coprinopsis sp. MPI-PUGE-AT-0042]|nr:GTPase inhibitor [Coprinopsis sp. MPI-PUGE-AT-0042]
MSKAASLASRLVSPNHPQARGRTDSDDDDDEALFAELEEEIENDPSSAVREQALGILQREMERVKGLQENKHGQYTEVSDEKEVIRITAQEKRCVVHFYHTEFKRCEIMDKHIAKLAPKYFNTRFFRVFVENVPWLVEKLQIKVLPCVICFADGVTKDRVVGFEELGNSDNFDTATLELRLKTAGVLQAMNPNRTETIFRASSSRARDADDDDFDL